MSPRDKSSAAVATEMALIESGLNHLRDQTDRDRRAMAERLIDLRDWREKVDGVLAVSQAQLGRIDDRCKRLETDGLAQTETLKALTAVMIEQRGALRLLKWLMPLAIAAGPLILRVLGAHW